MKEVLFLYLSSYLDDTTAEDVLAAVDGIEQAFNSALGRLLLYRYEYKQYLDHFYGIVPDSHQQQQVQRPVTPKTPSEEYGAEHLLRLLGNEIRVIIVLNPY